MYLYIDIYLHAYIYTYIYTYTHTCFSLQEGIYTYKYIQGALARPAGGGGALRALSRPSPFFFFITLEPRVELCNNL